jgi:SRSO17 transposase
VTDQEIQQLGPTFASWLSRFRACFLQDRTAGHFDTYCRGLLSDLPRKTVEPIALVSGTAVRTLQEFLVAANWTHGCVLGVLQRRLASVLADLPSDPLGNVGVIDETSCLKKGDKTPGVQRQYLGCVGKLDNGVVTVHFGVSRGRFQALLDAGLYLPKSWDRDRERCREAGIPDEVRYQAKWRIAFDQLLRLDAEGVKLDWLVFDEGYGSKVPFLHGLCLAGQRFVGEVPVNFSVRLPSGRGKSRRADAMLADRDARMGARVRIPQKTRSDSWWRAATALVRVGDRTMLLVAAACEATGEIKRFVTNALDQPLRRVLLAAFRRATIEHGFRLAKQEAGLTHFEGRHYQGLMRRLALALAVMGFVSVHTDRRRGEKPGGDDGAGVPCAERAVRGAAAAEAGHVGDAACRGSDPLPPAPQRHRHGFPQAATAQVCPAAVAA